MDEPLLDAVERGGGDDFLVDVDGFEFEEPVCVVAAFSEEVY